MHRPRNDVNVYMYVCMYVRMHTIYVCMHVCIVRAGSYACTHGECVCVCTRLYVCLTCFYMYIHLHIYGTPPPSYPPVLV